MSALRNSMPSLLSAGLTLAVVTHGFAQIPPATNAQDEEVNIVIPQLSTLGPVAENEYAIQNLQIVRTDDPNALRRYVSTMRIVESSRVDIVEDYLNGLVQTEGGNVITRTTTGDAARALAREYADDYDRFAEEALQRWRVENPDDLVDEATIFDQEIMPGGESVEDYRMFASGYRELASVPDASVLQFHLVQVVCPSYQLDYIEETLDFLQRIGPRFGQRQNSGAVFHNVRARNRRASELAAILNGGIITGGGTAVADDSTNTLFVNASSNGSRVLNILNYYDVPPRMVGLNVQILEVDVSDVEQLGIDWDAWKNTVAGFAAISSSSNFPGSDNFTFASLLGVDGTVIAEFLNYLVNRGRATVITNTNLTALNGQQATLSSMRRIPDLRYGPAGPAGFSARATETVVTQANGQTTSVAETTDLNSSAAFRDLQDVSTANTPEGVTLTFTPTIGTESMTASINCIVNSLVGQNNLDQPILARRQVTSSINLTDGETVLIGAFDKTTVLEIEDGIPLLRHIPALGPYLFQETTEELRQSQLVVFVTPEIDEHWVYTDVELENGGQVESQVPSPETSYFSSGQPASTEDRLRDRLNESSDASIEVMNQLSDREGGD